MTTRQSSEDDWFPGITASLPLEDVYTALHLPKVKTVLTAPYKQICPHTTLAVLRLCNPQQMKRAALTPRVDRNQCSPSVLSRTSAQNQH